MFCPMYIGRHIETIYVHKMYTLYFCVSNTIYCSMEQYLPHWWGQLVKLCSTRAKCSLRSHACEEPSVCKREVYFYVDSQASPARWCSMTNIKTWWDNMWRGKRAQRADWALSSLFTRVTKIPAIQACSLRRKTLKSRKKPLKFDIHNLLRIACWPKKSIHIKNNFFEKTSSSSWSKY